MAFLALYCTKIHPFLHWCNTPQVVSHYYVDVPSVQQLMMIILANAKTHTLHCLLKSLQCGTI